MREHINSATRLYKIFTEANGVGQNHQIVEVWAEVFNVKEVKPSQIAQKVFFFLNELSLEVVLLREKLGETHIPENEYINELNNIEEAISPLSFVSTWQASGQFLGNSTLTSLKYWGYIIPAEQAFIPEGNLVDLTNLLNELEELLVDLTLPLRLTETIKHQILIIRKAIEKYPIVGIKALKQVTATVFGEMTLVKHELGEIQSSEATGKLKKVWELLLATIDTGEKVDKAISLAYKAIEFFNKVT